MQCFTIIHIAYTHSRHMLRTHIVVYATAGLCPHMSEVRSSSWRSKPQDFNSNSNSLSLSNATTPNSMFYLLRKQLEKHALNQNCSHVDLKQHKAHRFNQILDNPCSNNPILETGKTNLKNKQTSVKQMHSLIPKHKLTAKRPLEQTLPRTRPLRMWSPNFVPNTLGGSNLELLT